MNQIKSVVMMLFFAIALPTGFAHATFFEPYAAMYTTNAQFSTTPQTTFAYSQKPWLYLKLYAGGGNPQSLLAALDSRLTFSAWQDPVGSPLYSTAVSTTDNEIWVSFTDSYWNSIKKEGTWNLTATSISPVPPVDSFYGESSFKVNAAPEPVSVVLFLLGGGIMAFYFLRNRRLLPV